MLKYILHRLLLMVPTLFGITLICFLIINLAPGGPVEQALSRAQFSGAPTSGSAGVSNEVMESIKKQYGFDQTACLIRYWTAG